MSAESVVDLSGIVQKFGRVTALDGVALTVRKQTIHALVGENGAGKTTLMKVLYGALKPTEGKVIVEGQERHFTKPQDALAAGIGMVSQHYSIIGELTCLENLMLGAEPGWTIPFANARTKATELATQMGFSFDWDALAEGIGPAQAQKLEILKLLWRGARIMILDEPTAMLSPTDADLLFAKLHELADSGTTIIVVTHRLPEVMDHCDDVTVLRGGKLIASKPVSETNPEELTEMIVGHSVDIPAPTPATPGAVILGVSGLTVKGERGDDAVKNVSFELRGGELTGLAGVDGNGQRELFQAILGLLPFSGSVALDGVDLTKKSTKDRLVAGIRLIAEDRHHEAVIEDWSIELNGVLGLHHTEPIRRGMLVSANARKEIGEAVTNRFPTKFDRVGQRFGDLSGGNQQKVVTARAFQQNPRLILAFQPTRGIDIHVSALVFQALKEQARAGSAVLLVSFDIDEILEHCDRVLVINHGEINEPPEHLRGDRQAIGRLMVGAE
ncbi:MAG: ABC transporter ATP-binding protein [Armatimonadetes bacterium]|nr:ABC transporter ATP-binding protein [Armatimonadota bacterium]